MRLRERVGIISFYLVLPALSIYIRHSKRTRIIVLWQGKILVLKNWLGDGSWSIPGGGLHADEDPRDGAIRELLEETGIRVARDDLEEIGTGHHRLHGLSYSFCSYVLRLGVEPKTHRQHIEVSRLAWLRPDELTQNQTNPDVLMTLELLKRRHPDFLLQ